MAKITKHGEDFYVIDRLACRGHKDSDGRMLAGVDSLTFAFRRPEDPPHINVDPVDVLEVLIEHLGDSPAADHLVAAQRALQPAAADGTVDDSAPARRGRGRPRKPEHAELK